MSEPEPLWMSQPLAVYPHEPAAECCICTDCRDERTRAAEEWHDQCQPKGLSWDACEVCSQDALGDVKCRYDRGTLAYQLHLLQVEWENAE